jgi:hypothetical protein
MDRGSTFCCVQCRLLQAPAVICVECAAPMVAPVELVRELLYYRDMKVVTGRDWAFITAMIAGGSLAFPVLAPVAIGSIVGLGVHKLLALLRRRTIEGVTIAVPRAATHATTVYGTPRKFRGTVSSIVDDAPVLLEHAIIKNRQGGVLLRRSEGSSFLLEREQDGPVLVTGVTRLTAASLCALRTPVRRGDARLARMGVPVDLAVAGELEIASLAEAAPTLAVTGPLEEEAVADLAFHRDGGRIPVMRGQPGAPVLIEDRRLLGVALAR